MFCADACGNVHGRHWSAARSAYAASPVARAGGSPRRTTSATAGAAAENALVFAEPGKDPHPDADGAPHDDIVADSASDADSLAHRWRRE